MTQQGTGDGTDVFLLEDTAPSTQISPFHRVAAGGKLLDPSVTAFVVGLWRTALSPEVEPPKLVTPGPPRASVR